MSIGKQHTHSIWLVLVVASAVGGWFFGKLFVDSESEQNAQRDSISDDVQLFPEGSPESLWISAVKNAEKTEFPDLLVEWQELFPEGENYLEGRPEHALRWLFGEWLTEDTEGFFNSLNDPDIGSNYSYWAAQVIAALKPTMAVDLIKNHADTKTDEFLVSCLVRALAELQPTLYLKMNPDGVSEVIPGRYGDDDWKKAITSLAKTDAVAAGNACLASNGENAPSVIYDALLEVARLWRTSDPPISEWVNQITDAKLRNFAINARLCALAEKDSKAALSELYSSGLVEDNNIYRDAPREIATQLAKADFVEALKLLKEVEGIFSDSKGPKGYFGDPFADTTEENSENPFRHLGPGRYGSPYEVENNGVRYAILREAVENLPRDPVEFFAALNQLRIETGEGKSEWQLGVEAELIRLKSRQWFTKDCLAVAELWNTELDGAQDVRTYRELAARAVYVNLEQTLAALDQVPKSARPSFAGEIIKKFPASNPEQRIALFTYLTTEQWTEELGKALGENGDDYASAIASLPAATTFGAREAFMSEWGKEDPEAAAKWLVTLPDDAAAQASAKGLAAAWLSYDEDAAVAWFATLETGSVRDGAASCVVNHLSKDQPDYAWQLASSISDPLTHAEALTDVGYYWKSNAPEKFRKEMTKAREALDLPERDFMFEPPSAIPDSENPFGE